MTYRELDPPQAKQLLEKETDRIYLDVRTEEEFAAGHVPGAYNVPFAVRDGHGGMLPNPDFARVVGVAFAGKHQPMVVGCAVGGRSARACELLAAEGYRDLVNLRGGYSGLSDPSGALLVPGWQHSGFATTTQPKPGRSYAELRRQAR